MKKLIAFIVLGVLAVGLNAQTPVTNGGLAKGALNSITAGTSLAATGRIIAATNYVFNVKVPVPYFYQVSVRLMQKTASDNTATIKLYGALEDAANSYKQIGNTVNWKGTTTDTCVVITSTGS